jgi:hypothetical protein
MKYSLFLISAALLVAMASPGQVPSSAKLIDVERIVGVYCYRYQSLASDTAIKDGNYELSYKNKLLESGRFNRNKKEGVWRFYNFDGALEFTYDFSSGAVSNYERRPDEVYDSPCFFLGSPVVLYRFLASNLSQPRTGFNVEREEEMLLSLLIDTDGTVTKISMVKSFNSDYDSAAIKAASMIPSHWRWIPAKINGNAVQSEYIVKILVSPE